MEIIIVLSLLFSTLIGFDMGRDNAIENQERTNSAIVEVCGSKLSPDAITVLGIKAKNK